MSALRPHRLTLIAGALVAAFLLLPLVSVIPVSFTPRRFLSLPEGNCSWRHYADLVNKPEWGQAILMSIRIGVVSSVVATALGLFFSLGIWMARPRLSALLMGFVLLPMVAPPVVSALTLYFFLTALSQVNDLVGYDTWAGVALAHTVMIAPFAVVMISVALAQVDRRIDLAARAMGAGMMTRVFRVILPNIRFGVATALFLTFMLSWEEIGVTIFITSVNVITLPRLIWMGLRDNIDPAVASISVVMIVLVVLVIGAKTVLEHALKRRGPL